MFELFNELVARGEAAIDDWIVDEVSEGIRFECKRKENADRPNLDGTDRKTLGKTLSAFANSEGGLLVWGVDAREVDGIDKLIDKHPIANLAAFQSKVCHAISELISPPIAGIQIQVIPAANQPGAGYLAIYVPSSDRRPHMCTYSSERGFFFRNGHSSVAMEVHHIRDQMLRLALAKLTLRWEVRVAWSEKKDHGRSGIADWRLPIYFDFYLDNLSQVSARAPYLKIQSDKQVYQRLGAKDLAENGLPITRSGPLDEITVPLSPNLYVQSREFGRGADYCLHPGMSIRVATICVHAPAAAMRFVGVGHDYLRLTPDYNKLPTISVKASYACLDSPIDHKELTIDSEESRLKIFETGQQEDPQPPA